jgi:hypothetical protein
MKQRHGFVSNSSSSSFVLAVAVIADKDKAKAFLDRTLDMGSLNHYEVYRYDLTKKDQLVGWGLNLGKKGEVVVDNFHTTTRVTGLKGDEELLVVEIANNEGDGMPPFDDDVSEAYRNFSLDQLPEVWQKELYEGITEENGFVKIDKTYGAARNG